MKVRRGRGSVDGKRGGVVYGKYLSQHHEIFKGKIGGSERCEQRIHAKAREASEGKGLLFKGKGNDEV